MDAQGGGEHGDPVALVLELSDTVRIHRIHRMHRKQRVTGVSAKLKVLEAAPHGFFLGGTPEDEDLAREIRRFIETHCLPEPS